MKENSQLLSQMDFLSYEIAEAFAQYMFGDEENYTMWEWIWDNPISTMEINDYYFSLDQMYDVLANEYPVDLVFKHYEYWLYYSGEKHEYYINLKSFVRMYDWKTPIEEWAKKYKKERDENTAFWKSPVWKKKQEENLKPLLEEFEKEIKKYNQK